MLWAAALPVYCWGGGYLLLRLGVGECVVVTATNPPPPLLLLPNGPNQPTRLQSAGGALRPAVRAAAVRPVASAATASRVVAAAGRVLRMI